MKRIYLTAILLLTTLTAHAAYWSRAIQVDFPDRLGGLEYYGVRSYEPEEIYGYSLRYQNDATKADIYVYTLGLEGIGEGPDAPEVQEQMQMARSDILGVAEAGYYLDVNFIERDGVNPWPRFIVQELSYTQIDPQGNHPAQHLRSLIAVTGYRSYFVKVRISSTEPASEFTAINSAFMQDLAELLTNAEGRK